MAPPAGTSSMLRSRRRDATLKPNRTLDRNASRGMLYENEELRLRTININAEVEKGQSYIKKLRRENEQLKREIWNLREEYERLENYVKSREQSENEEDDGDDEDSGRRTVIGDEEGTAPADAVAVTLETVVEEDDENGEQRPEEDRLLAEPADDDGGKNGDSEAPTRDQNVQHRSDSPDRSIRVRTCSQDRVIDLVANNNDCNAVADAADPRTVIVVDCTGPAAEASHVGSAGRRPDTTSVTMTADVSRDGHVGRDGDDIQQQRREDRLAVNRAGNGSPDEHGPSRVCVDAALLRPHTACFDVGNNCRLHDLTVDEVIDAVQDAELKDKLLTVCLTDERCYMTFANAECLERMLHTAAFRIRDVSLLLMDTGAGAVILSLTGVPDTVADKDVLKCLKKYGTIIGGVERKTARGGTAGGERYVRVRPTLGAPRYLWFGSDKVTVRQLTEHETGTMNSIARRKSFRSRVELNLKMAEPSASIAGRRCGEPPCTDNSGVDVDRVVGDRDGGCESAVNGTVGSTAAASAAISARNGFRFPSAPTAEPTPTTEPTPTSVASHGSPRRPRPATAAGSPARARRRPSLTGFRRDPVGHRAGSACRADGGEDAESDASTTICRRELSVTGRERAEKVPWCGCWGNGCL